MSHHPDIWESDDIILRVVQAVSLKGSDQADVILTLLEYYDIVDQTFAVCCNSTSIYLEDGKVRNEDASIYISVSSMGMGV